MRKPLTKAALLSAIVILMIFAGAFVPNSASVVYAASGNWQDGISGVVQTFGGGAGSSSNPFLISSKAQLAQLAYNVNNNVNYSGAYFKLTADLDLSAKFWTPIGSWQFVNPNTIDKPFQGTFDGDNHVISGLTIGTSGTPDSTTMTPGLFGNIEWPGSVKNLGVTNVAIYSSAATMGGGALAGRNTGPITSCYTTGDVTITGGSYAGGIAGYSSGYFISNSYSLVNVTGGSSSASSIRVGGLIGYGYQIKNSFSAGNVEIIGSYANYYTMLGGVIGEANSNLTDNYYPLSYWNKDVQQTTVYGGTTTNLADANKKAIGGNNTAGETDYLSMTTADMQSQSFVDTLNANRKDLVSGAINATWDQWEYVPGSYPRLVPPPPPDSTPPTISSVTKSPSTPTNGSVTVTVTATDSESGIAATGGYSFDGGVTWQNGNTKTYNANTTITANTIRVKDTAGNIAQYGSAISITNIDITSPVPGNTGVLACSNVTQNSVDLSWTAASDNLSGQANLQYKVVRSASNNINTVSNAEANGTLVQDWQTNLTAAQVAGLTAGTTYYFNVIVKDEAGNKALYTIASQTTSAIPAYTATASANTVSPVAEADNAITLTVKDSLGNTDISFTGAADVTISGIAAAPDNTYGTFNGTVLDANSAGAGQTISVTFTAGVATASLTLNNAGTQTVAFSIAGVATPATNTLSITPTGGTAASMTVTTDITAPAVNGGQFAQQPVITLQDAHGNISTGDNSTEVTASKKDAGEWTLTGTTTVTAANGVVTFTDLGATNAAQLNDAQLAFNAAGMTEVTSTAVILPEPEPAYTAAASTETGTPAAGENNTITLTVKDSFGSTDTTFAGAADVTISGIAAAPDNTYGTFNGTVLDANSAGAGQTISVTFTAGVATASLTLNNAGTQTVAFSIAGVATPATNTLSITPTGGTAASMTVTTDITAPAVNGGQFAQQPVITLQDAHGNISTGDNSTEVTVSKKDAGEWTLTGTTTVTAANGVVTFTDLGATNAAQLNDAQLAFNAAGMTEVTSTAVILPEPEPAYTAAASTETGTPAAGENNTITLTVKDSFGSTDTTFSGAADVTISGIAAAPDNTYGTFNGTVLDANSAGAGQTISVTFTAGVATASLTLNNAGTQTVAFSIAGVATPATNTLSITPTGGTAASMTVTTDITAPAVNGGQFAQQPVITLQDAHGNTCTGDSSTEVTVSKKDAGEWTLTGTTTVTAINGVVTFAGLGATNAAQLNDAQLAFNAAGMTEVTSSTVILPKPEPAYSTTASAETSTPEAGENNTITLTVRDSFGNPDTTFNRDTDVTISGVTAAPDGTYGRFNGTVLDTDSAGAGQTIVVTFTYGVATADLKLYKAGTQTISFNIAGAASPAANTLSITPTAGPTASMTVTTDITAPAVNGGQFAQQPVITLKDAYGNICTADNNTVVTASRKDAGAWTLTGTTTATAVTGVVTFTGLGAANISQVVDAQLSFNTEGLPEVTSCKVILPAYQSRGHHSSSTSIATDATSTTNTATNTGTTSLNILVNGGITESAGTLTTSAQGNQTVTTVTVDPQKLDNMLKNESSSPVVSISVNTKADVVVGQLNGQTVKNMETKEAVLEIETGNVTYTLPAAQINIDNVSDQIGQQVELKDIEVNVTIAAPSAETAKIVEDTANKNNYQVVVKPVEFEITCTSGSKTVDVSRFNGYVERTVAIPDGVDPTKITTGVVLNADGTFSHVPTKVVVIDGKYYAKINSLTNSTYSVIYHPVEFADMNGHWAKEAVNDMGSRLVVSGYGQNTFNPDKAITRAEFAAIVVKSLGLRNPQKTISFSDVTADKWYYEAVRTAYDYGIISGYADRTFKPNALITREEAMAMIAKAMDIAGLDTNVSDVEITKQLGAFTDGKTVADWARKSVAASVRNGVVTGYNNKLSAKTDVNRAETAVMVRLILKKAELI